MEDWNGIAQSIGYEDEKEMLTDLYVTEGLSVSKVAKMIGAGTATIARRLGLLGIQKRGRGGPNNLARQRRKLHKMDQRIVMRLPLPEVAKIAGVSKSLVYKYRRGVTGVKHELLRDQPDGGAEPVFRVE